MPDEGPQQHTTNTLPPTNTEIDMPTEAQNTDPFADIEERKSALIDYAAQHELDVEACGTWLWLEAEREHRPILIELGCKFSSKKQRWYLKGSPTIGRGGMSMEYIREKYGSHHVVSNGES